MAVTPFPRPRHDIPTGVGLALIHVFALLAFVPAFFSWNAVLLCIVLAWVTGGLGITLGYHRLLTHRSFRMPKPLEYLCAFFGTLALQGGPIWWVATHRKHHAHSDQPGDPHDIHKGWMWAHVDWLWQSNVDKPPRNKVARWTKDMINDPVYQFLDRFEIPIQFAFGGLLFLIGGWPFVVWGVFVRLVLTYHVTWLVNSAAHTSGYRTYRTTDKSTNNWIVGLLAFGEGWHNNHHAFPFSARHGLAWFEFDLTWLTIRVLSIFKLATSIRLPTEQMMDRLRLPAGGVESEELSA